MGSKLKIIKNKKARLSEFIGFDEAVVRLWQFQLRKALNSLVHKEGKKHAVVKKNATFEQCALAFTQIEAMKALKVNYYTVDVLFDLIKGYVISDAKNTVYVIHSADTDKALLKARTLFRAAIKGKNFDPNIKAQIVDYVCELFPCPSWFKPRGYCAFRVRNDNPDAPEEKDTNDKTISDLNDAILEYTGVDYLHKKDIFLARTQSEYKKYRYANHHKARLKHKYWTKEYLGEERYKKERQWINDWHKRNIDKVRACQKKYRDNNKEKCRLSTLRSMQKRKLREQEENERKLNEQRKPNEQ